MRRSDWVVVAALMLMLPGAADNAFAAGKEPVTGGLLALPGDEAPASSRAAPLPEPMLEPTSAPVLTPEPAPPVPPQAAVPDLTAAGDDTSWGLLLRGGYFGLPNFVADELFFQHPDIEGSAIGAEIRYHGAGGGRGFASIGLAVDSATARTGGEWRHDETDDVMKANGNVSMLAFTLTGYWSLFPTWYVHPYIGIGIGAAHVEGFYEDETERVDADIWIPVVHIPVGLAFELGKRYQFTAEGRFLDGIAIGGALQVRF